jgi:hypothetical protein
VKPKMQAADPTSVNAYLVETITPAATAIVGYVGKASVWVSIEEGWRSVFGQYADEGAKPFVASNFCGDDGHREFNSVDIHERAAILNALSGILAGSDAHPVWSAVITTDWYKSVTDATFLEKFSQPFHLCFEHVVYQLAAWARRYAEGRVVIPMFARQRQFANWITYASQAYGQSEWYRNVLGPIAFGYPEHAVPLQAAELFAHNVSLDGERRGYGTTMTLETVGICHRAASAVFGPNVGGCFGEKALRSAIVRFRESGSIWGDAGQFRLMRNCSGQSDSTALAGKIAPQVP